MIRRFLATALAFLALGGAAFAQSSPGLTYGQVPTAAQWNGYFQAKTDYPMSASTITNALGYTPLNSTLAPSKPMLQPSSGNMQCSRGHFLWFTNENLCSTADVLEIVSTDPSANGAIFLSGTITAGDVITMHFLYGGNDVVVSYTVTSGDAASNFVNLASKLSCAVQHNTTLYNNGAACVDGITPVSSGGYANGRPLGYVVVAGDAFGFDHRADVPLSFSYTVSGAGTEVLTVLGGYYAGPLYPAGTTAGTINAQTVPATGFTLTPGNYLTFVAGLTNSAAATLNVQSTGARAVKKRVNGVLVDLAAADMAAGVSYAAVYNGTYFVLNENAVMLAGGGAQGTPYQFPNSLDNNPVIVTGREPGASPAPGSVDFVIATSGPQTITGAVRSTNYGLFAHYIGSSVTNHLKSAWILSSVTGGGTWFGSGVYSNMGGSPFGLEPTNVIDKGTGTFNAGLAFWLNGTLDGGGANLAWNGGAPAFTATGGLGINATPSNGSLTAGSGLLVTGNPAFSTGAGLSVAYDGQVAMVARDWGAGVNKQLNIGASLITMAPNAGGAYSVQLSDGFFLPATDNFIALGTTGGGGRRWSTVAAKTVSYGGATSGDIVVQAPAVAGTGTLTLPVGTDTLVGEATTATLTNKSIAASQLTGTIAAARMPALTGDVTSSAGSVATTIASNTVTNAKLATMADQTFKGNISGGVASPSDLTPAQMRAALNPSAQLNFCATGINANSVGDTPITIALPTGVTRYRAGVAYMFSPSISLTTAQVAIYGGASATGTVVLSPTALSPLTSTGPDTAGSLMLASPGLSNNVALGDTSLFFRITTAQGSAATFDACLTIIPLG